MIVKTILLISDALLAIINSLSLEMMRYSFIFFNMEPYKYKVLHDYKKDKLGKTSPRKIDFPLNILYQPINQIYPDLDLEKPPGAISFK